MYIYFQHGWGFSRDCFEQWPNSFPESTNTILDRGYWGAPVTLAEMASAETKVLVCHSLGLHYFSEEQLNCFNFLVVLGGFASFHGEQPVNSITRKHLQRMRRRLETEPEKLLADFYSDCSWPFELPDFLASNIALLEKDLTLLDTVLFKHRVNENTQSLLIHGSKDRLVPLGRGQELQTHLPGQLHEIEDAGHGLPFTHQDQCIDLIKKHIYESKS